MKISSTYVGARSESLSVALSPRQTMNYAAALGDNNPHYFDDTREAGICAPPMIAVALTWPLSSQFDRFWGDTGFPLEAQQRQVHYNESISWARPLRSDEHLSVQGEIVAMTPHKSGTLVTIRYIASGRQGDTVFTEHISGLLRGVMLSDAGRACADLPGRIEPSASAKTEWCSTLVVDPLAAHVYDGCSDIVFPIHTSIAFARNVGLPKPIYHGTATLGLAVREILNREGDQDPARLREVHCGFRGMVYPGTAITVQVHGVIEQHQERVVWFDVVDESGAPVLRDGQVHLRRGNTDGQQ